jgi:hypothetical protein
MSDYESFLKRKRIDAAPCGFEPREVNEKLFPFQRDIVRWALRRGRAALFAECGLGKGWMALEWAREVAEYTGKPVLILAPLAVTQQFKREAAKLYGSPIVTVCKTQGDVRSGINTANYERFDKFDPREFGGIVADECFAADTLIDTPDGPKAISAMRPGDAIICADGASTVEAVYRREVPYAVKVSFGSVSHCVSSPNHPFFTQRGWVGAQDLRAGDYVLESAQAVHLVRGGVLPEVTGAESAAVLRDILLSELAHDSAGCACAGALEGSCCEARSWEGSLVSRGVSGGGSGETEDGRDESSRRSGDHGEDLPPVARDGAQTFRAWWQWSADAVAASEALGCSWERLGSGVCRVAGPTDSGIPDLLQARLSAARKEVRDRGGWQLASRGGQEGARQEEGRCAGWARVDGIEILEQGSHELDRFRDAGGKLYFYDLKVARHPSYSVNGLLVHNSSILKDHTGKTRTALIEFASAIPYRLCCTATPAPNDHEELGNHSEFLGILSRTEMLSTWFVHDGGDTQSWRLKGHAEDAFWRWVCSWAVALTSPADLGYDSAGYDLPPLTISEHIVDLDDQMARAAGQLFAFEARTLDELRGARKASLPARVECAAAIVAQETSEPWLVWCDLNSESEALTKAIPGAVEIKGSDPGELKESRMLDFIEGRARVLVSKPSICGHGINLQHCARSVYVGLSHSFEQWHQSNRRTWRFGQTRPVHAHVVTSSAEGRVVDSIKRKQADAERMVRGMVEAMSDITRADLQSASRELEGYSPTVAIKLPRWLKQQGKVA